MSDQSQGPGWWLASDGKWYPPQPSAPTTQMSVPPPAVGPTAPKVQWWKRPVPLWGTILTGFVCLILGAATAGSGDTQTTERAGTVEDTTTTTTEPQTTTTEAVTTTEKATTTTTERVTTTSAPAVTSPPATAAPAALMPDVVCTNLQDAQDEIQTTGVFLSLSEDATGAGRSQILDSNWLVVRQTPAPGTPIEEGDAVLYVVKYGEPNDCGL